jgi:hypothetical protein
MSEKQKELQGWVSVFRSSTDYEADFVRDRLDSAGIPAATFTQRDHSFNLNVGDMAKVYVMVPPEKVDEAKAVLAEQISDEDLEAAAAQGAGSDADEHGRENEEPLDSGVEKIDFGDPDDPPEDERLA